jgi:hypothetical protein
LQVKTKIVSSHTADSKPVKQGVNGTVILPHLVFPVSSYCLGSLGQIRGNQLPFSAIGWQHESQIYLQLLISEKIAKVFETQQPLKLEEK